MNLQRVRLLPTVLIALLLGLLAIAQPLRQPVAMGHANVVWSDPAANAVLDQAPTVVTIRFTEPIEPAFSDIQLLDSQGTRRDNGDSTVADDDPHLLTVTAPPIPNGTYVVAWTNVSTVDGHKVRGSFLFAVGGPISSASFAPMVEPSPVQSPLEPVLRWITLFSILAVVGGLSFNLLILQPTLARLTRTDATQRLAVPLRKQMVTFAWLMAGLFLLASVAHLLLQATITHDAALREVLGAPLLAVLFDTGWGRLWLWRMGLFLVVLALLDLAYPAADVAPRTDRRGVLFSYLAPFAVLTLTAGVLFTITLSSHAAAVSGSRTGAIVNDLVHLIAASIWMGGLFCFVLCLTVIMRQLFGGERRSLLSGLVTRFSPLAALSVGLLAVSGSYATWAQVTVLPAVRTPYGLALVAKLVLLMPLLLLAALNLLWVRPRLVHEDRVGVRLRRLLIAEAVLAVILLLPVGLLTTLEPARQVFSRIGAATPNSVAFEETVEGTRIQLTIAPAAVGTNSVMVDLTDARGNPIDNASDVAVRATFLGADLGETPVAAIAQGGGRYVIDALPMTIAGTWQLELVVRRPDAFDARTAFRFAIPAGGPVDSARVEPAPSVGRLLLAGEIVLVGLLVVGFGGLRRPAWSPRRRILVTACGAMVMVAGVALAISDSPVEIPTQELVSAEEQLAPADAAAPAGQQPAANQAQVLENPLRNPYLPNLNSLAIGQEIFEQNCVRCHGPTGRGDGPDSEGLDPPPANLLVHIPLHADIELFRLISAGKSFSAMPAFGGLLSKEEIWHLVNYLRAFKVDQSLAEDAYSDGVAAVEAREYEQALDSFTGAIKLSPQHALAFVGRGVVHRRMGNLEKALADHTRALELSPKLPEAYYQRGLDYEQLSEQDRAITDYAAAVTLASDFVAAYHARGLAYVAKGELTQAILDLSIALELDETFAQVYWERGMAYRATGDLLQAKRDLEAYIELATDDENRAKVVRLVDELAQQIDSSAARQNALTAGAGLVAEALPSDFAPVGIAGMDQLRGYLIGGRVQIEDDFAFAAESSAEIVWGFTTVTTIGPELHESPWVPNTDDLLRLFAMGIGDVSILARTELTMPSMLDQSTAGLALVVELGDLRVQVDALHVQSGAVGATLFMMYPDGEQPLIAIRDLALTVVNRLNE